MKIFAKTKQSEPRDVVTKRGRKGGAQSTSASPPALRDRGLHKQGFLLILPIALLLFFLASPFSQDHLVRLILAAASAPIILRQVLVIIRARRMDKSRRSYLCFLQFFSGELSSGNSISRALISAAEAMPRQLGRTAPISRALLACSADLYMYRPLDEVLVSLGEAIGLSEAYGLFNTLTSATRIGSRAVHIVRDARDMAATLLSIEAESRSEQASTVMESATLLAMPFVIAFAFGGLFRSLQREGASSLITAILPATAFGLAILAIVLMTNVLFSAGKRPKSTVKKGKRKLKEKKDRELGAALDRLATTAPMRALARRLLALLPAFYLTNLKALMSLEYKAIGEDELEVHIARRILIILLLTGIIALPIIAGKLPIPALLAAPLLGWALEEVSLRQKSVEARTMLNEDMPLFLETLLQYLLCGQVLRAAIENTLQIFRDRNRPLPSILDEILRKSRAGQDLEKTITGFASRCQVIQIQSVFMLMGQFVHAGHSDILGSLKAQKQACWDIYKDSVRNKTKMLSGKLLLPMTVDLVSVALLAVQPALSVFMAF